MMALFSTLWEPRSGARRGLAEVDAGAICRAPTSVAWELERPHNSLNGMGKRSAFECGEFRGWLYKSTLDGQGHQETSVQLDS